MNKKETCCNMCGRMIPGEGCEKQDFLQIEKIWGYFSEKDGERHHITLCEKCYDLWITTLQIPPHVEEVTEILS